MLEALSHTCGSISSEMNHQRFRHIRIGVTRLHEHLTFILLPMADFNLTLIHQTLQNKPLAWGVHGWNEHWSSSSPSQLTITALHNAFKINLLEVEMSSICLFNFYVSSSSRALTEELPWFTSALVSTLGLPSWNFSQLASIKLYTLCFSAIQCSMEWPGTPPW